MSFHEQDSISANYQKDNQLQKKRGKRTHVDIVLRKYLTSKS